MFCVRRALLRRPFLRTFASPSLSSTVPPPFTVPPATPPPVSETPSAVVNTTVARTHLLRRGGGGEHPLYAFFRRMEETDDESGKVKVKWMTISETYDKEYMSKGGRGWRAEELRLKSFEDLHVLWYVLLRERNLLATQAHEMRRLGVHKTGIRLGWRKADVKKSMARIKLVMNERRLAYLGAVALVEEHKEREMDRAVLDVMTEDYERVKGVGRWSRVSRTARRGWVPEEKKPEAKQEPEKKVWMGWKNRLRKAKRAQASA